MTDNKGRYMQLLLRDFHALEALLREGRLESGVRRMGYELELNFVDRDLEPSMIGTEVREGLQEAIFTSEFARFNLEINSQPLALTGGCFSNLAAQLSAALTRVRRKADDFDSRVLMTGIVPTLSHAHITPDALTPEPRYRQLYDLRKALKGEHYEYRINGADELLIRDSMALFAGCVTSFQTHYQIDADDVVDSYNWAQLLAAPLLACATYSPLFLGKRLWHETRVALFEQATDTRNTTASHPRNQARVLFGDDWLQSPLEMLQEDIASFDALFTITEAEDPRTAMSAGEAPALTAWNLFNSSIYRWNRLCYGRLDGRASLRIENRMLPSGPTVEDMVANAAFWTGAMAGMPDDYRQLQDKLEFQDAKQNFFNAARLGLDVSLRWPGGRSLAARDLILEELLPIAHAGLKKVGVSERDANHYLGIIRARTETGRTGSEWMLSTYSRLMKSAKRDEALQILTAGMLKRQEGRMPVHTWEPVDPAEGGDWHNRLNYVHRFMTTDLYKVGVDDVMDLAAHIMDWKRIGHIPVEDSQGKLVGIITKDTLINSICNPPEQESPVTVGDMMVSHPITVAPDTTLTEAVNLLLDNQITCLPVTVDGRIVGIVTDRDFLEVARQFLQDRERHAAHGETAELGSQED